jgi:hypothetical protein
MELVHEAIVERREIFQAVRARFLQTFKEKDLGAWIELLQELAQLSHGITAGGNAENIMYKTLDELLSDIFTIQIAIREFTGSEKLIEWNSLRSKGDRLLLMRCHADRSPGFEGKISHSKTLLEGVLPVKCIEGAAHDESKD